MQRHLDHKLQARAKLWAALTLLATLTAGSAVAIANAQGGSTVHRDTTKKCSTAAACISASNSGAGDGMLGTAANGFGVEGESTGANAGVGGYSLQSNQFGASGVYGDALNGFGVYGFSRSTSGYGLVSQGNAFVEGLIFTGGSCKNGCSSTRHQAAFVASTSQPTIDDVGEGTLRGGAARVALSPDFANTIDTTRSYIVMLTPEGDASLYVTNRTAAGFDVREVGGGHASISFAYRIVAKPYGVRDVRLPFKTIVRPMAQSLHQGH
ncbi:MAG: hypothetical protein JO060_04325 [Candidatus Eremiobacteraeota bacterium]|nr:hypothetical protein [Candidatus Eremiobacteraeota bacterium]